MEWLVELVTGSGIAHSILVLALVISGGLLLGGKIKIFGISLGGTTWILFLGIFLGHLGLEVNGEVLHFLKEFGLILFIYSIGMQVGPSFFFVQAGRNDTEPAGIGCCNTWSFNSIRYSSC